MTIKFILMDLKQCWRSTTQNQSCEIYWRTSIFQKHKLYFFIRPIIRQYFLDNAKWSSLSSQHLVVQTEILKILKISHLPNFIIASSLLPTDFSVTRDYFNTSLKKYITNKSLEVIVTNWSRIPVMLKVSQFILMSHSDNSLLPFLFLKYSILTN